MFHAEKNFAKHFQVFQICSCFHTKWKTVSFHVIQNVIGTNDTLFLPRSNVPANSSRITYIQLIILVIKISKGRGTGWEYSFSSAMMFFATDSMFHEYAFSNVIKRQIELWTIPETTSYTFIRPGCIKDSKKEIISSLLSVGSTERTRFVN